MDKQAKLWIAAIWIGWLVIITYIFAGCDIAKAGTTGSWTDFIAKEREIERCDQAYAILKMTIAQQIKIANHIDDPKLAKEVKVVLNAELRGLFELEADLNYWINTSCKEA